MAYTYHISFNDSDWTQFYPLSANSITWETEPGEIFKRPKINEIKIDGLRNTCYATLESYFTDSSKFGSYVYYKIKRSGVDTFYFIASINDGRIDLQNKIYYITPRPNDDYEKVLKGYNLIKDTPISSTYYYPTINTNSFIDQSGGIPPVFEDVAGTVTWANTGGDVETASLALLAGRVEHLKIIVTITDLVNTLGAGGAAPTLDARTADGVLCSNVITLSADGKYTLTLTNTATQLKLSQDGGGAGDSGVFTYKVYEPVSKSDGYLLENVINDFLGVSFLNTGLTAQSTILWNDALPSVRPPNIDTYITANPNNDYVIEAAAIWNYIVFAKTDSLTGDSATKYQITFKELMDILKIKLRMFWYIDSDGDFRIEHEKYFNDFASQLDITTLTTYKPEVDRLVYNYDKSNIYSQLIYSESNEDSEDWLENLIEYDSIKTTPNTLELTPPKLSTDTSYVLTATSPDSSGYLLLQCVSQNILTPLVDINESVMTADTYYPNVYLSWAWLIKNYYSYFGEADEADINSGDTLTLDSTKYFKKQSGVKFYYDGILTWIRPVTLEAGTGWIDKMELDLGTGFYNLEVGFDPY